MAGLADQAQKPYFINSLACDFGTRIDIAQLTTKALAEFARIQTLHP
jgi:hypothetical protein